MSIKAVAFDLDDTLYPEIYYIKSGFRAVGEALGCKYGIADGARRLYEYFVQDKADVFGRILRDAHVDYTQDDIDRLVRIYRGHEPVINLSDETRHVLEQLRKCGYKLGVITDGRPLQQRNKIKSLGLEQFVDEIIVTDELGGVEYRKPNPKAFELLCAQLDIEPQELAYVGDNPQKDFAVKRYLPIKAIQFEAHGLYRSEKYNYGILPDKKIKGISEVLSAIKEI